MGSHFSQIGINDLGTLWENVPVGGEVIITRNEIKITNNPRLDIGKRVVCNDLEPSTYRRLRVSLSDLPYGDDTDLLSPSIILINPKQLEEKKRRGSSLESSINENDISTRSEFISDISTRSEFIPELAAAGIYHPHMQSKKDSPMVFATPETQSEDSISERFSSIADSTYQVPGLNPEGHEYMSEMSQGTNITTRSIAEENMRDLHNFLLQQLSSAGQLAEQGLETALGHAIFPRDCPLKDENNEDKRALIPVERQNSRTITTEKGALLAKKLATQAEQKGMRECHVYFTPRTSAEIWPPLVVTVGEEWDFVKVIRKSIANLQRSINKGERDGTHDWLFDYHPNKDITKIRKELKVLFGPKVVSFRDSHLRKTLKDITGDFINKMWILQKEDDKQYKARVRANKHSRSCRKLGASTHSYNSQRRSKSLIQKKKSRKSIRTNYSRISQKL